MPSNNAPLSSLLSGTRNVFGSGGQVFRPQDPRANRSRLIQQLLSGGLNASPGQHPAQAFAGAAKSITGALLQRAEEERFDKRREGINSTLAEALQAGQTAKTFFNPDDDFKPAPSTTPTARIVQALMGNRDTAPLGFNLQLQDLAGRRGTEQKERDRAAVLAQAKELAGFKAGLPNPTPLQRNLEAAGIQPGSPEFSQAVLGSSQGNRSGFTLGPGQQRFDATGNRVAGLEAKPAGSEFSGPQGNLKPAVTGEIRRVTAPFLGGEVDPLTGRVTFVDPSSRANFLAVVRGAEKRLSAGEFNSIGDAVAATAQDVLIKRLPFGKKSILDQAVAAVSRGAPESAVKKRLQENGVDPVLLDTMLILGQ